MKEITTANQSLENPNDSQTQQCKHYAVVNSRNWKDILSYKEHEAHSMCIFQPTKNRGIIQTTKLLAASTVQAKR